MALVRHIFGSAQWTARAVWYDTRNAANNTDSQLFYSFSTDAGVTWSPNVAVSNAFNPFEGYPNQSKIGDYITIVSDETGGNVAYSATFNFNPNHGQHEEDVYYVRVSPTGGPTPTPTASAHLQPHLRLHNGNSYRNSQTYAYAEIWPNAGAHPTPAPRPSKGKDIAPAMCRRGDRNTASLRQTAPGIVATAL